MSNINDPETVCARCLVRDQSIRSLSSDLAALQAAAQALVNSLPGCYQCDKPATRAFVRGEERYCDEHAAAQTAEMLRVTGVSHEVPEYPRAAPLRALLRCLGEGTGERE